MTAPPRAPLPSRHRLRRVLRVSDDRALHRVAPEARTVALDAGLTGLPLQEVLTVAMELSSNLLKHAHPPRTLMLESLEVAGRRQLRVTAADGGPGVADLEQLFSGQSTAGTLGRGLAGVRELMDELFVESEVGVGTTLIATRWAP